MARDPNGLGRGLPLSSQCPKQQCLSLTHTSSIHPPETQVELGHYWESPSSGTFGVRRSWSFKSALEEGVVRVVAKQTGFLLSQEVSTIHTWCCGHPRNAEILKYTLNLHTAGTRASPSEIFLVWAAQKSRGSGSYAEF